jgi:DNA-directed RNA polymerase subunit RPC12/RpoP
MHLKELKLKQKSGCISCGEQYSTYWTQTPKGKLCKYCAVGVLPPITEPVYKAPDKCPRCSHEVFVLSNEHNTATCEYCRYVMECVKVEEPSLLKTNVLNEQIGGNHYHEGSIQPIEYVHSNNLDFFEGNAIKYVTRNRRKGTPVEDLKKAIHYIQLKLKLDHNIDSVMDYPSCNTSE